MTKQQLEPAATCGLLLVRHGFPIDVAEAATCGLLFVFKELEGLAAPPPATGREYYGFDVAGLAAPGCSLVALLTGRAKRGSPLLPIVAAPLPNAAFGRAGEEAFETTAGTKFVLRPSSSSCQPPAAAFRAAR
ncbi:hypothetical protein T492DRAFT_917347 [Pavlovales sp. CCMP2436]|nr:hypothetical protein T492DRAFT_917347 [Pavlovales sp. CCMP2436]